LLPPKAGHTDFGHIVVQTDGKIIFTANEALARYNSDGSTDSSFGTKGVVAVGQSITQSILQADGKIVIAESNHTILRYNSDGSVDTAFGTGGKMTTGGYISSLLLEADGKLVVTEQNTVSRYNTDGSLDTSFGNNGKVTADFAVNDTALQANGDIIVTGSGVSYNPNGQWDFYTARYHSDGSLDTTFSESVNSVGTGILTYEDGLYPALIDSRAHITDAQLDALNGGAGNYSGATLTLARHGGANADDVFAAYTLGNLVLSNGTVTLGGVVVGTYQQSGGQLGITFAAATSQQANSVLDQLTYTNSSSTAPTSLQLDWTFSDGNAANPLSTTASTPVTITPVDDGHSGYAIINGTWAAGQTLTADNNLSDPDNGVGTVSYQWIGGGSTIGTGPTLVLTQAMLNEQIQLAARYTDGQGFSTTAYTIQGTAQNETFDPQNGYHVNGLGGNDTFFITSGGPGDFDYIDGGTGTDTANYYYGYGNITVNLGLTTAQNTVRNHLDTLLNIENVYGSNDYTNNLTGNAANNSLFGGNLNDTLNGGDGNDALLGGAGNDSLDGGAGIDTAYYFNARAGVTVNLALTTAQNTLGAGTDTLLNIENLSGSSYYNDTLTGNTGNNALYGLGGNDTLDGGAGNDRLDGGAGTDTASYASASAGVLVNLALSTVQNTRGAGIDTLLNIENLRGSSYSDTLLGNTGANTLLSGAGNDLLAGGLGNDTLIGGSGQDTFAFNSTLGAGNIDTITDFNVADDTIRLSKGIFTTLTTPGVLAAEAFKILGNGGVEDGSDHLLYNTATGSLSYDADGSGAGAAVQIAILGTGLAMTNADFMVA
jgi:uncharacterized delta-60 repeat protein